MTKQASATIESLSPPIATSSSAAAPTAAAT